LYPATSLTKRAGSESSPTTGYAGRTIPLSLDASPPPAHSLPATDMNLFSDDFEKAVDSVFEAYRKWRLSDSSLLTAATSSANPSQGSRHLRLTPQGVDYVLRSPFFGPQPSCAFDVTFDLAVTPDSAIGQSYTFTLVGIYNTGTRISSGIAIQPDDAFQVFTSQVVYDANFTASGASLPASAYRTIRIRYDRIHSHIEYSIDGQVVSTQP
jgi:hypothetical protein